MSPPKSANEKTLAEQIENLQVRVGDQQNLLASKEGQQRQADAELAGLRQRIVDLETAKKQSEAAAQRSSQTCRDLEAALAALRLELEENRRDFQRQQLLAQELDESARQQLAGLQNQLVERQVWAGAAANELQRAKDELVELHQHIAELQDERQELATAAAGEVEQARRGFEAELSGLQSALAERDHDLQNSQLALSEIERKVSAEVENLRSQFADRQEFLDVRDDQLREALGQVATLQQRVGELEAVHQQATIAALESERTRDVLESQIASLRHEVAVRERALTERQEAVTAVEFALHGRIQALQQELARGRSAIQARESELDQLRGESDSRRVRVIALESAADIEMAARHALESDRAKLESDLAGLNEILDGKEATLRAAEIALRAHQEQSAGEIAGLGRQVDEQKGIIDQGATDLDQLRAESARWREQNNQSEQSRHELELNWRQSETRQRELAERLEAKENELRWVQSNAHEQQETAFRAQAAQFEASDGELRGELARLRSELEERQKSTEQTQQVIEQLNAEIADLREQLAASLRAKENELQATRTAAEAQLAAALSERLEVERRRHSEDLGKARLETSSLQRRIEELEREFRHAQLIANQRLEQISQDYAAQIENLNAEISRQSGGSPGARTCVDPSRAIATQRDRIFDTRSPGEKSDSAKSQR